MTNDRYNAAHAPSAPSYQPDLQAAVDERLWHAEFARKNMAIVVELIKERNALRARLKEVEVERDAFAHALWSAEDQWGDDYLWKKWHLSKSLTHETKDRLQGRQSER